MEKRTQDMKKYIDPFNKITKEYAKLFDEYYFERKIDETKELIKNIESECNSYDELTRARIYYLLGTAYADILEVEKNVEIQKKSIFYFNSAITIFEDNNFLDEEYLPYVYPVIMNTYVNYGNSLDNIGRISSSIRWYKKALKINPIDKMALGNLSVAYMKYAWYLYDYSHRDLFNKAAYEGFEYLFNLPFYKEEIINKDAFEKFEQFKNSYDKEYVKYLKNLKYENLEKEYSYKERKYRLWASKERLFLNPLNDLYDDFRATYDIIHLPTMVVKKRK